MSEIIISPVIEELLAAQSEAEAKEAIGINTSGPANSIIVSAVIADFMDSATATEARAAIGASTGSGTVTSVTGGTSNGVTITFVNGSTTPSISSITGAVNLTDAQNIDGEKTFLATAQFDDELHADGGLFVGGFPLTLAGYLTTTGNAQVTLAFPSSGTPTYVFPTAGATLGTVTTIPDGSTNGVTWTVANRTTTPTFTFSLGAITPSTVVTNSGAISIGNASGTLASISATGDIFGTSASVGYVNATNALGVIALYGESDTNVAIYGVSALGPLLHLANGDGDVLHVANDGALTLSGTFNGHVIATGSGTIATTSLAYITPGAGIATALAINTGSAGAPVLFNGAGGTPSSLTGTNISGTAASLTAGNATKWTTGRTIALTGDVTYTSGSLDGSGNVTGTATLANIPAISGANLTSLNASNLASGTAAVGIGGTGLTSYAVGDLLYASGAAALSKLADVATGNALISGGVTTAPSWGKIALTTHISGVLPVANGGTNASSASITAFNNITGYSAAGATGTTSTNLVFSTSPTLTTPAIGAATGTSLTASSFLFVDDSSVGQTKITYASGYPGIWFGANTATPSVTNYSFLYDKDNGTIVNAPSGKNCYFRVGNNNYLTISSAGVVQLGTAFDVGIFRNASGVMEVNSGTAGTLRDITLRNITASGTLAVTGGGITNAGAEIYTPDAVTPALNAGAAVSITTATSTIAVNGVNALTLANGTNGQIKTLICTVVTAAGTATITPTTTNGFTTAEFTAVGQTVTIQYTTVGGWSILAVRNATIA